MLFQARTFKGYASLPADVPITRMKPEDVGVMLRTLNCVPVGGHGGRVGRGLERKRSHLIHLLKSRCHIRAALRRGRERLSLLGTRDAFGTAAGMAILLMRMNSISHTLSDKGRYKPTLLSSSLGMKDMGRE